MKKTLGILFLSILLVGCGANADSNATMDSYVTEFESAGMSAEPDKPFFSLIGAKDGVMFKDDEKVVVYEFETLNAIKTAEESLPAMKDWERNGLFVLESSNEEAKKIFKSVK